MLVRSGLLFGLYYVNEYRKYAKEGSMTKYYAGAGAIVSAVAAMFALLPAADAAHYIGLTGCTLAVILMASPLATLKTVIQTKNTSAMPFTTSLATFMNASSWTGYGLLVAHDPMVWGPNMIGFVAACVQMGLFAKYGIQSTPNEKK
jgi:solute carrier family 50 protein (sugar transporter)